MGVSGLSFAGLGGAGACSVDRHIALVGCKHGIGVWFEAYHSRSSTDRVSTSGFMIPSLSPVCDDALTLDTSVTSSNRSLASARRSAGFFAFGTGRAGIGAPACLRFLMQNIHRLFHINSSPS
jgi:hypothetical protein